MPAVRQSLRHGASFKQQPAVGQSLRHGLRPCHLPLTREAKPPQTPRYPAPLCRFHIGPVCGGAGPRGRDESRPYESILRFRPFGTTATARATVGRDALIPPHPAPPQCSAGGPWPSPTNRGKHGCPAGKHKPRGQPPSPCRGAHCAPGRPFRHAAFFKRQPAVRQSLRHGLQPCHLPLTREAKLPQTPRDPQPLCRGQCSHRPGKPRAAANTLGRIWNPPLRTTDNTQQPRPPAPPRLRFSAFWGIITAKRLLYKFCAAARRSG